MPTSKRKRKAPTPLPPAERPAVTVAEAAALLDVHEATVWRLLARGALPRVHVGRTTRIYRAELEAFLANGGHGKARKTTTRNRASA
jgi:excisionase family DNA binding protein